MNVELKLKAMNEILKNRPEQEPSFGRIIKPNRFVWHVTERWYTADVNIAAKGLIANYTGGDCVYAHNDLVHFADMYNVIFYEYDYRELKKLRKVYGIIYTLFSYWRIDTSMLDIEWFIDPNMARDCTICDHGASAHNFICTPNNIPPFALKLFYFDIDRFHNEVILKEGDGVVSAVAWKSDFQCLVPERFGINAYRMWRIRNSQANVA